MPLLPRTGSFVRVPARDNLSSFAFAQIYLLCTDTEKKWYYGLLFIFATKHAWQRIARFASSIDYLNEKTERTTLF